MADYNKLRRTKQSMPANIVGRSAETQPAPESGAAPSPAQSAGGYDRKYSVSFKLGPDLFERLEGALENVSGKIGCHSKADVFRTALELYLDQLEEEFNNGEAFQRDTRDTRYAMKRARARR